MTGALTPAGDPRDARPAARSPVALGALGGGALVGLVVASLNPLGLLLGPLAWVIAVIVLARRGTGTGRQRPVIDPFALSMPWRSFVKQAVQARQRFERATAGTEDGPLRDRLDDVARRLETAVEDVWEIANRGQALSEARRRIDTADLERQLESSRNRDDTATADSLAAQLASARRMDDATDRLESQLSLIQARTDEALTRAAELAAGSGADVSLTGLDSDLDGVVDELEALRQGLAELSGEPGSIGPGHDPPRDGMGEGEPPTGGNEPGDPQPGTA